MQVNIGCIVVNQRVPGHNLMFQFQKITVKTALAQIGRNISSILCVNSVQLICTSHQRLNPMQGTQWRIQKIPRGWVPIHRRSKTLGGPWARNSEGSQPMVSFWLGPRGHCSSLLRPCANITTNVLQWNVREICYMQAMQAYRAVP